MYNGVTSTNSMYMHIYNTSTTSTCTCIIHQLHCTCTCTCITHQLPIEEEETVESRKTVELWKWLKWL